MAPNQDDANNGISLDEEELRRLLEQPLPEEGEAEATDEAVDDDSDGSSAPGPLGGATGSGATAGQIPLGQDTIDQLLAQARDAQAAPDPVAARGGGAMATASASPATASAAAAGREAPRAPERAEASPARPKAPVTVQPVQFSALGPTTGRRDKGALSDLGILLDVPLHITVELGRAEMPIREILALGPGSVIELDRSAGEVLDVLVNGTLVAQGEVVVVDEQFGIRLTHVFSPSKDILEGMKD